jgi:cytochrome c nitrite reductase small subunit
MSSSAAPDAPDAPARRARPPWRALALVALVGGIAGLSAFTFRHAQGASYLYDDPAACANCHVMQDVFDSWNRSRHHAVAVCNDCHTPHTFPEKYLVKGLNGVNHSAKFTLGGYPTNIRVTALNAAVVRANCVACHAGVVNHVATVAGPDEEPPDCVFCHGKVGH